MLRTFVTTVCGKGYVISLLRRKQHLDAKEPSPICTELDGARVEDDTVGPAMHPGEAPGEAVWVTVMGRPFPEGH